MRKIFSVLVMIALVVGLFGCGDEKKADNQDNGKTIVGFIYNGSITDGGYNQAHDAGRQQLESELDVETLYKENVSEADFEKTARGLIDQGATIIFATSFEFMEPTVALSKEFKDVSFFHCSGYLTTENMANYFGRIYQARYLAGMIAGSMTKNNKLGFVGAFPIPEVISSINAFTLGAKAVNPDITVEVQWSNTWFDPVKEKEAAKTLISNGVDVIAQHQNTTAVQQAAEEAGIYSIGYNLDMSASAPKANLTSNIWNWGFFYVDAVKSVLDGTFEGKAYFPGIETGLVDLAPINKVVPQEVIDLVEATKKELAAKEFDVFDGEIKDQSGVIKIKADEKTTDEDITNMNWFVEGVIGKIN